MAATDNNATDKQDTPNPNPNNIEDYNGGISINTNLIMNSDETNQSYAKLISGGETEIDQLRVAGKKNDNQKKFRAYWLKKLFWWCAGADRDLLTMCPSDHAKYVGVGTTIFFTALMAFFSCWFAMKLVFGKDSYLPLFVALFWSAMIFSLDRFITNTMYSDGKVTISKKEFFSGLPRIVIAIILGIVISAPLELKIFEKKINIEIENQRTTEIQQISIDAIQSAEKEYLMMVQEKNNQIEKFRKEGDDAYKKYNEDNEKPMAQEKYAWNYDEDSQSWKRGKLLNKDEVDKNNIIIKNMQQNNKVYEKANNEIMRIRDEINDLEQAKGDSIKKRTKDNLERFNNSFDPNDITRQLHALHNIAMEGYKPWFPPEKKDEKVEEKKEDEKVEGKKAEEKVEGKKAEEQEDGWLDIILMHRLWYYLSSAQGLIMLLFILIDISPVLYKMMLADGVYDKYMHAEQWLATEKVNSRQANILNHLDKSELKRVAPFITAEMYQKMAGDFYVSKTEEEFRQERKNRHGLSAIWRIFPFSFLRFLFWKEEETPSAPKIDFNRTDDEMKKALKEKNKEIFNYVLNLKAEIIKKAYQRWYDSVVDKVNNPNNANSNDGKEK